MIKAKVLAVIFSLLLMIVTLDGCYDLSSKAVKINTTVTEFNTSGYPIINNKITLKMMGIKVPQKKNWEEHAFFKRMEDLTNIHFEFTYTDQAAWREKVNLAFSSNDLPDVFWQAPLTSIQEVNYANQGYLIPVDELVKMYAPNLSKIYELKQDIRKSLTHPDGHIYSFPFIRPKSSAVSINWHINKVWLDKLQLNEPMTLNDLYNILKAFKEKDPNCNNKQDEIPITAADVGTLQSLVQFFGIGYGENGMFADSKNKVLYVPMTNEYKELLIFLNKLYKEGLLDNDCFTQNPNQLKAKGVQNKIGILKTQSPQIQVGNDLHFDYKAMEPIEAPNGKLYFPVSSLVVGGNNMITKYNKYPEATVRWFDYLYTEEGGLLVWMGKENEDFKKNNDGTFDWILPKGMDAATLRNNVAIQGGLGVPAGLAPDLWEKTTDMYEQTNMQNRAVIEKFSKPPVGFIPFPTVYFSQEDSKRVASVVNNLNSYVQQFTISAVIGDISVESEWEKYIEQLKKIEVEELVKLYQKAYNNYLKN